nr:SDR family NAD(P)-dependent oxidoreductase [Pseudomonas farris]
MTTRIFLITGASKGIGRALAAQLFQAGHHVVGIARNSLDRHFPGTPCRQRKHCYREYATEVGEGSSTSPA